MTLQISDGVNTVTLSGDGVAIKSCTYFPTPPERNGDSYNDVTETFNVILEGTPAAIITTVNTIEMLLDQAATSARRNPDKRLIASYNVTGIAETHKSEILEGRVPWDPNPLYRRLQGATTAVQIAIIWRRRYYWELADVALSTNTITNGTGGNSFAWSGIAGTLPAPLRLTLTNASGVSLPSRRFYILNDADNTMGTTAFLTPATPTQSWGAGVDHNTLTWPIVVPQATAALMTGERYRILAGFTSLPDGVYVRASVYAYVSGLYLLLQRGGDVLSTGKKLLDLGSLNLSPAGNIGTPSSFAIVVTVYAPLAGSATLAWLQVSPAEPALTLYQNGFSLPNGSTIVHDDMDDYAYMLATQRHPLIDAEGELLLYPGRTNRLRILFDEDGAFVPSRQLQVSGTYRPRKLTV